jgi:hypothetical protein
MGGATVAGLVPADLLVIFASFYPVSFRPFNTI